jgi:hemerythrin-like domain-containing protein
VHNQAAPIEEDFVVSLIDQFIDAPDDFHHILERKAYRRAWFRSGRFLPSALDIDEQHATIRGARERLITEVDRPARHRRQKLHWAIADYAACARMAIAADERVLFPLLHRHLTNDDWRELATELCAYETIVNELRSDDVCKPFDMRQ